MLYIFELRMFKRDKKKLVFFSFYFRHKTDISSKVLRNLGQYSKYAMVANQHISERERIGPVNILNTRCLD
jgi:hypothetical protein